MATNFYLRFFFINPIIKTTIIPFRLNIQFITFSFKYFFYSEFFFTSFLQFFFIKTPKNWFTIQVTITYVHGTVLIVLIMLTKKTSSDQFRVKPLVKIFLYFQILTWSPTLNLGSFSFESSLHST